MHDTAPLPENCWMNSWERALPPKGESVRFRGDGAGTAGLLPNDEFEASRNVAAGGSVTTVVELTLA